MTSKRRFSILAAVVLTATGALAVAWACDKDHAESAPVVAAAEAGPAPVAEPAVLETKVEAAETAKAPCAAKAEAAAVTASGETKAPCAAKVEAAAVAANGETKAPCAAKAEGATLAANGDAKAPCAAKAGGKAEGGCAKKKAAAPAAVVAKAEEAKPESK